MCNKRSHDHYFISWKGLNGLKLHCILITFQEETTGSPTGWGYPSRTFFSVLAPYFIIIIIIINIEIVLEAHKLSCPKQEAMVETL